MKLAFAIILLTSLFIGPSVQKHNVDVDEVDVDTTTVQTDEDTDEGPSEDIDKVGFYLYPSAENLTYHEQIIFGDNETLYYSSYSSEKPVIFIIHGFVNNYTTRYSQTVKNAFLETGYEDRYNIIVVDWGALSTPKNSSNLGHTGLNDLARNPHYQTAVKNVPKVGRRIAEFIDFLIMENYLDSPDDVYLLGFSLGAQISGSAGYEVKQNMSCPIGRITGLDPAGPLFNGQSDMRLKLDASDATFVDIVHTNQGQSGYEGNTGHADFYPNGGGPNQNDCLTVGVGVIGEYGMGICAHNRAWVYYIMTLDEDSPVLACKCYATPDYICRATCSTRVPFGFPCPPTTRGTYYVEISSKEQKQTI